MSASLEQLLRDARIDLVLGRIEKDPSVIDDVVTQVDNEIRSIRFNSIFVLGELGEKAGPKAVSKITEYLNDEDWSVRREAARSLGKIGHIASSSIPRLADLINEKEVTIRSSVVNSLGRICVATEECIDILKNGLKDKDESVRTESAKSLGLLGPDAFEVIPDLTKSMRDPNWTVRTASAEAISGIGKNTIKSIPTLIHALSDDDWRVRNRVISTLAQIGEPTLPYLLDSLNHNNAIVRRCAVETLGELKISSPEVLEKISGLLDDKVESVRGIATDALRSIGEPAIPSIIKAYDEFHIPLFSKQTIRFPIFWVLLVLSMIYLFIPGLPLLFILLNLGGLGTIFAFISFFYSIIYGIIIIIDIIYLSLGYYLWFHKLFDLNNKQKVLLIASIGGIGINKDEPINFIITQLNSKKNYIRLEVARTLGKIGMESNAALNALEGALLDKKANVRREAALAIGKLGLFATKAIPSLIRALSDKDKDVRWRATEALGKLGVESTEVLSALQGMIHDECDYVCEAAELAIDNIKET